MMLLYHGGYSGEFTIISHRTLNILGCTSLKFVLSYNCNFDTVHILADFPLAYKHSNVDLDIAIWCNPAQNLQLKLLS